MAQGTVELLVAIWIEDFLKDSLLTTAIPMTIFNLPEMVARK